MRTSRHPYILIALLLALVPASSLLATSYVVIGDGPLADQADVIVNARVANQKVSDETGRVMTHYTVLVEDLIKGDIPGSGLEVRVLGGIDLDNGRLLKIWGSPEFSNGETLLLFLGENEDGSYHVMHMLLGAFHRKRVDDQSFWVRSLEDELVAGRGPTALAATVETERDGELFVEWLRHRAVGMSQPADYFRAVPETERFVSAFTLIADDDEPIIRWFDFDERNKVIWKRHADGHPAVPTGGRRQLRGAIRILNRVKMRPGEALTVGQSAVAKPDIRLKLSGTTSQTGGFDEMDGVNTLYGSDLGDWISNNFSCSSGGVLAIGGILAVFNERRPFRGQQVLATAETELVINDGTDCFFLSQGPFASHLKPAEEVYLHELMHTLGLGHTCGDDGSPKCSKSARANDSNMRASVHGDGVHAMGLGREDRGALEFLYTHDPQAPVPSKKLVPGARKFCKKAKGCGEGQGNCRKDKECNAGLVCTQNVGAQFGLPPSTNVCTSG